MVEINVSVDTAKLDRLLSDFPLAIAAAKRNALVAVGSEVVSSATQAFRSPALRPSPWAPRKPTYTVKVNKRTGKKTRKLDSHPLLIKSGSLRQSIGWRLLSDDAVLVGTDKKYGAFHQLGTKKMPARPFMPVDAKGELTPRIERKIKALFNDALNDELRKLGFR